MGDRLSKDSIIDTALELAVASSWEAVRLHAVAARLGVGLDEVRRHFREKEEIVEAWFDRADGAMLAAGGDAGFREQTQRRRLELLVLAWLETLAPYHRVTRQMILGKLEPGHLHIQIPALLRISRTVQWLREAGGCRDTLPRRALAETLWTLVFVSVFVYWLSDDSDRHAATWNFLERRLTHLAALGFVDDGTAGSGRGSPDVSS